MKCPFCNEMIKDNISFCPVCNKALDIQIIECAYCNQRYRIRKPSSPKRYLCRKCNKPIYVGTNQTKKQEKSIDFLKKNVSYKVVLSCIAIILFLSHINILLKGHKNTNIKKTQVITENKNKEYLREKNNEEVLVANNQSNSTNEYVIINTVSTAWICKNPLDDIQIGEIPAGTKVQIFEKREARSGMIYSTWYRVKYNDIVGWISQYETMGDIITENIETGQTAVKRAPYSDTPKLANPSTLDQGYIKAYGNIWVGVELYFGPNKSYVGQVLGGNDHYIDPTTGRTIRGIKIRYNNGSEEWKNRDAIINGYWYVKENDPAISAQRWREYTF